MNELYCLEHCKGYIFLFIYMLVLQDHGKMSTWNYIGKSFKEVR